MDCFVKFLVVFLKIQDEPAKIAYGVCYNVKLFSELALRAINLIQYFLSYMLNSQPKDRLHSASCGLNGEVEAEHIATPPATE